jgi:GDP-4-dehydro-6-deoxy-D-mannose reductase
MKQRLAFITGIAGFAGSYLAEELLEAGYAVSGAVCPGEPLDNIEHIRKQVRLVTLDILDPARCRQVLAKVKPDYIYHLAAMASVGKSYQAERMTFLVNFEGSLNVFDAATSLSRLKSILFISSADTYGAFSPKTKTLTEDQPLNPISPYGISKAAAEAAARYYHRVHGLPVVLVRAFNHSGPRQGDGFVIPAFARQIARIEAGLQPPVVMTGDTSAKRDISDVRDIVRGYRLAAEKGKPGEIYQLCTGRAVSIQTVLNMLVGLSSRKIRHRVDRGRLRKAEIPVLRGDNHKATIQLGYRVRYNLRDTLRDTLNFWRARHEESKHKAR